MKIKINFGAMVPKLRDQIKAAGFRAYYEDVAKWQEDADAITWLSVRSLLSEAETAKARKRLTRLIAKGIAL